MKRRPIFLLILALAGLAFAGVARADSWAPPRVQTYVSTNGAVRLTVTPRRPASALAYFEDLSAGRRPAGQRAGSGQASAEGVVERRDPGGGWAVQWRGPLVNDVAPVSALVADDGAYVVTFDNWHFVGFGDNVVVIYDAGGHVVRSLVLSDFLPEDYVAALPRSVSSIQWGGAHRIAGDRLILAVRVPSAEGMGEEHPFYFELEVALVSGRPAPLAGPAWERALATAAGARRAQLAAEAVQTAFFTAPLRAPEGVEKLHWYQYLAEAFFRLDPDWRDNYPATNVLRMPRAPDYAASRANLRTELGEDNYEGRVMMFASPAPENLADVLAAEVGRLRPGALREAKIYVVASDALWPRMVEIFARTGATLVQVDPAEPIPQRPERLRERAEGLSTAP